MIHCLTNTSDVHQIAITLHQVINTGYNKVAISRSQVST